MNLVDEKHIVGFQVGQERSQVLGFFQHGAAGLAQIHPQLGGDDVAQRGLAQTGWAKQQHMVQRLLAFFGRTNENFQLLAHLGLAHVLFKVLGTQGALNRFFAARHRHSRNHARGFAGGGGKVVGLDAHGSIVLRPAPYLASALSASLMPSLTPTSAGKPLRAAAASLSL